MAPGECKWAYAITAFPVVPPILLFVGSLAGDQVSAGTGLYGLVLGLSFTPVTIALLKGQKGKKRFREQWEEQHGTGDIATATEWKASNAEIVFEPTSVEPTRTKADCSHSLEGGNDAIEAQEIRWCLLSRWICGGMCTKGLYRKANEEVGFSKQVNRERELYA